MREAFIKEAEAWGEENPRLWWAYEQLADDDELRDRLIAGIVKEDISPAVIDDLVRFADALEAAERAEEMGTVLSPPAVGLRRPMTVVVTRMSKVNWNRNKTFRVDFVTEEGWSGYFDTTNPRLVEQVSKNKNQPITLVGEIERYLYDFLVVVGGKVRII